MYDDGVRVTTTTIVVVSSSHFVI